MRFVSLGIPLAVLWMLVGASFTLPNFLLGWALAAAAIWLVRDEIGGGLLPRRPFAALALGVLFVRELLLSAIAVARLVLQRRPDLRPGIFAFPLRLRRDGEIALLANLITLTPGTLSVDVSADRRTLFVHALDARDPDAARAAIRDGFEAAVALAFAR